MAIGKKTGGRAKGVGNKDIAPIREKFQQLLDGYSIEEMRKDLKELDGNERLKIVIGLAEFVVPKLQRSDISGSLEVVETQTFVIGGKEITF